MILFDETIRQTATDGTPFPKVLDDAGMIPGIKVDTGAKALALLPGERSPRGSTGCASGWPSTATLGARFAKWRAVINIADDGTSRPTFCIDANAHALARYAALCQEAGIVPIVEPEVLMDGDHTIERCYEASRPRRSRALFDAARRRIGSCSRDAPQDEHGAVRARSARSRQADEEVAEQTAALLPRHGAGRRPGHRVPVRRPGRRPRDRRTSNEMNRSGPHPWALSFSYGRALQAPALKAWRGEAPTSRPDSGRSLHRARCNGAARDGRYNEEMETRSFSRGKVGTGRLARMRAFRSDPWPTSVGALRPSSTGSASSSSPFGPERDDERVAVVRQERAGVAFDFLPLFVTTRSYFFSSFLHCRRRCTSSRRERERSALRVVISVVSYSRRNVRRSRCRRRRPAWTGGCA